MQLLLLTACLVLCAHVALVAGESEPVKIALLLPPCKCPENEERGNLKCNRCEPSCGNKKPKICTKMGCPFCNCDCKKGFFRDVKLNKCVKEDECPAKYGYTDEECEACPLNEEPGFKKCNKCEATCTKPKPTVCTKTSCADECSCDCKPGFYRDVKNNKCVPMDDCPTRYGYEPDKCEDKTCPKNEEFGQIACNGCEPTCKERVPKACTKKMCDDCTCGCKPGFFRDEKTKKCVLPGECPEECKPCIGENEEPSTECKSCQASCAKPNPLSNCTANCPCSCSCKKGFVRDDAGKCIEAKSCPPICEKCPENEQLGSRKCGKCEPTCDARLAPVCMMKPGMCKPCECECKPGFFRNKEGKCVPEGNCPPVCKPCPENEEQGNNSCNNCEPSCEVPEPKVCTKKMCLPCTCDCKKGFFRNKEGKCVPKDKCPVPCKPCPEGEEPGMNKCNNCEPTCDVRNPLVCTKKLCDCACNCKKGLYRNKEGKCVTGADCPPVCKPCGPNEQPGMNKCNNCEPSCDNRKPQFCTMMACQCGCDCKPGFYRFNTTGECVPVDKCPPPPPPDCKALASRSKRAIEASCGENEEYGTLKCNNCEPSCAKKKPGVCTKMACVCSCDCKKGFFRDHKKKKCVKEDECPAKYGYTDECEDKKCPENEERGFKKCNKCEPTCAKRKPGACTKKTCEDECSCDCKPGFYRDVKKNKCVKEDDCPAMYGKADEED